MTQSRRWPWSALAPVLHLGWPLLWRDRWRWLARRWAFALAGFGLSLLVMGIWKLESLDALWEIEAQLQDLQVQLLEQQKKASNGPSTNSDLNAPMGPPPVMAWWPAQGTQAEVWPQLERLFAQHRLRLLSLRPERASSMGALPSQTVALRLQGRFEDWVAVWAALNKRGPVWSIERLRITSHSEGVAIEVVLRLWLSPRVTRMSGDDPVKRSEALFAGPAPATWHFRAGAAVFVTSPSSMAPSLLTASNLKGEDSVSMPAKAGIQLRSSSQELRASALQTTPLSTDPADWPLEQVRLVGIWQQAHEALPILMAGPHWVRARVGQRIGTQGHVVHSIHAQEVHLRASQGPIQVIGLEKAKP